MSEDETSHQTTQHALVTAWGELAQRLGLDQRLEGLHLHKKQYHYKPQTKVLEFLVATWRGWSISKISAGQPIRWIKIELWLVPGDRQLGQTTVESAAL